MTNKEQIKAALTEMILNTNLDIGLIEQAYCEAFASEGAEILAEIWVEVNEELPELN